MLSLMMMMNSKFCLISYDYDDRAMVIIIIEINIADDNRIRIVKFFRLKNRINKKKSRNRIYIWMFAEFFFQQEKNHPF